MMFHMENLRCINKWICLQICLSNQFYYLSLMIVPLSSLISILTYENDHFNTLDLSMVACVRSIIIVPFINKKNITSLCHQRDPNIIVQSKPQRFPTIGSLMWDSRKLFWISFVYMAPYFIPKYQSPYFKPICLIDNEKGS